MMEFDPKDFETDDLNLLAQVMEENPEMDFMYAVQEALRRKRVNDQKCRH